MTVIYHGAKRRMKFDGARRGFKKSEIHEFAISSRGLDVKLVYFRFSKTVFSSLLIFKYPLRRTVMGIQ